MRGESIHPRHILRGPKVNTCKPKTAAKLLRAKKGIEGHLDRHPRDEMSRTRLQAINKALNSM